MKQSGFKQVGGSGLLVNRGEERHPKDWVARMVQGRGLAMADKTLYTKIT